MHEIAQLHSRTWRIRGCIFSQRQLAAGEAERTAGYSIEERTLEMMMMVKRRWSHSPLVVGTTRALQVYFRILIFALVFAANSKDSERGGGRMLRASQFSLLLPSLLLVRGAVHAGYA
jgi:hypothetical protein